MNSTGADKPPYFSHWLGPWRLGKAYSIDGEITLWVRPYQEQSACGQLGCCEMQFVHFGPVIEDLCPHEEDDIAFVPESLGRGE